MEIGASRDLDWLNSTQVPKVVEELRKLEKTGNFVINLTGDRLDETLEIRGKLAKKLSNKFGAQYNASNVIVGYTGKALLNAALEASVDDKSQQDEVCHGVPAWPFYKLYIKLADGVPLPFKLRPNSNFSSRDLKKFIHHVRAAAVILNSPHNPTSTVISEKELKKMADILLEQKNVGTRKPIIVIEDRFYEDDDFDEEYSVPSIVSANPLMKDRTIIIGGAAKSHDAVGYAVGPSGGENSLIRKMIDFLNLVSSSHINPELAEEFSLAKAKYRTDIVDYDELRAIGYKNLKAISGLEVARPLGGFYLWFSVKNLIGSNKPFKTSEELMSAFLKKKSVAMLPGEWFDCPGYARIHIANVSKDILLMGIQKFKEFVEETNSQKLKEDKNIQQ